MTRTDPPEDWREREVTSDDELLSQEKELRIVCPNDVDYCHIATEIPTIMKWIQSIEESEVEWVRTNSDSEIIAIAGKMPKGMMTLKSQSKKSNTHGSIVTYGPLYERDGEFPGTRPHEDDD